MTEAAGRRRPEVVVFDLGGVLIDWNPRHLYRQLFPGDEAGMERFLTTICSPSWNETFDAGRPFRDGIAELTREHPHEAERIAAYFDRWIEMVRGPIEPTVRILERLAANDVPLYALTNWSAETFPLVRHDPTYGFFERFRDIVVSGELGVIKPDPAIFHVLLDRVGRPADACMFIDDSPRNVAAAERLGFTAHRFMSPEHLEAALTALRLL